MKEKLSDENLLAERVGQLQQENDELKRKVNSEYEELRGLRWKLKTQNVILMLCWLIPVLAGTLGAGAFLWKVATTPDAVSHCKVDKSANSQSLHMYGVVPWGVDQDYGEVPSLEEGVRRAKAMSCPLWPAEKR